MPVRKDVDILYTLFRELAHIRYGSKRKWSKVSNRDRTSSYFPGGPPAVAAFADVLNHRALLRQDDVVLNPNAIRLAKSVGAIFGAMIEAYEAAGWTVTAD